MNKLLVFFEAQFIKFLLNKIFYCFDIVVRDLFYVFYTLGVIF